MDWLKGKRTYILAAAALLAVLGRYLSGDETASQALTEALTAVGLITARIGAKNDAGV